MFSFNFYLFHVLSLIICTRNLYLSILTYIILNLTSNILEVYFNLPDTVMTNSAAFNILFYFTMRYDAVRSPASHGPTLFLRKFFFVNRSTLYIFLGRKYFLQRTHYREFFRYCFYTLVFIIEVFMRITNLIM